MDRRNFLAGLSAAGIGSIVGCSDVYVPDDFDSLNTDFDVPSGRVLSNIVTAPRLCELEYSCNIESSDEGYEDEATADILIMTESSYQEANLKSLNSQSSLIEDPSRFDVTESVEVSGILDAGLYRIAVINSGTRPLTANMDVTVESSQPERDVSDCNNNRSELEIRHLEIFHDPEGIVEQRKLMYHIIAHGATDGEYEMTMTLMTDREQTSLSVSEESDVCKTHFVNYDETELNVNNGFFERGEEVRAQMTIKQDGNTIGEEEVIFTPTIVDYDE